ncbi:helix-turn-helix domain-containing protein [Roseivivax isoporae]|uniref:XRE family transcriptional regulator n=1 Tax=Roseivivax isoporae LMG 25204 TaxID=1449351 RepID=X7F6F0_9RHOB|nr:XRE family transcriptional regulator [Roseivivax isoporae]ETX28482.1 XRE family transcriptional regulator [Roseivivax isoporae LMG 25204]
MPDADHKPSAVNARLGRRLQALRQERGLTLADLARLSGVSRSMLSQIERGASSPTVATLLNLTRALEIEFAALVDEAVPARPAIRVIAAGEAPVIENYGTGCTLRILSPPEQVDAHEVYEIRLEAGARMDSAPHRRGCREQVIALDGAVRVTADGEGRDLGPGDTALYPADVAHAIAAGETPARILLIVRFEG